MFGEMLGESLSQLESLSQVVSSSDEQPDVELLGRQNHSLPAGVRQNRATNSYSALAASREELCDQVSLLTASCHQAIELNPVSCVLQRYLR